MTTESEITGAFARELREKLGLTQAEFWRPLGVKQSVGCRYEAEVQIPQAVRILLVARYVSGVKIDASTPEGVAELWRLGSMQSCQAQAKSSVAHAKADVTKAIKSLEAARNALQLI